MDKRHKKVITVSQGRQDFDERGRKLLPLLHKCADSRFQALVFGWAFGSSLKKPGAFGGGEGGLTSTRRLARWD